MEDFDLKKYLAEGKLYEATEEEILKKLEQGLKQGLGAAKALENEPVSKKDAELKEVIGVTLGALAIGMPGILKLFSKISQGIGWLFGLNKGDGNMASRFLAKISHGLHMTYVKLIAKGLKSAYPSRYDKNKDGDIDNFELKEQLMDDAEKIYAGMLAAAAIATGVSAASAASSVVTSLKGAEIAVDAADIAIIAGNIAKRA
jgi:hypothetical protein